MIRRRRPATARCRATWWAWARELPAAPRPRGVPAPPRARRARSSSTSVASTSTRVARSSSSTSCATARETGSALTLVLIGKAVLRHPRRPGDRAPRLPARPGEVGRSRRVDAPSSCRRGSRACPWSTLEAFWAERPVLANAQCEVLRGQCQRVATPGSTTRRYDEFREALALLERDADAPRRAWGGTAGAYFEAPLRLGRDRAEVPRPASGRGVPRPSGAAPPHDAGTSTSSWPRSRYGDAIGNEALAIQKHLRAAGFESDIFAEKVHPRMAHLARPLWEYARGLVARDGVPLPLLDRQRGRAASSTTPRTGWSSIYHNITPAHFFLGFHPHLAGLCYHGRRELEAFAPRTELGARGQRVQPPRAGGGGLRADRRAAHRPRPRDVRRGRARRSCERLYGDGRTQPAVRGPHHPQQEDRRPDPRLRRLPALPATRASRLLLVGDYRGHERYFDRLLEMVRRPAARRRRVHGAGGRRRARRLLPGVRPLPVPLRARGLLRAAAGGHALRRARASPTTRARCGRRCTAGACCCARSAPEVVAELVHRVLTDSALREQRAGDAGPGHARGAGHRLRRAASLDRSARRC